MGWTKWQNHNVLHVANQLFAEAKLKLVDKIHSDFRVNLLDWKNKHGNTVVHESFKKER